MVRITEELVRKKSEHNELMISTLEELSLHQEDIEKIEHFQNWCKDLRILLLQSNLIPKIENLFKLKKLEYLNLAINNIEKIENLEQLESLNKLDLTLNFIGELTSIENLKNNYNLSTLYLVGNPCTDFPMYREFVIATLPQLDSLDGADISRTQKLKARKNLHHLRKKVVQLEAEYKISRDEQKIRVNQAIEQQARETEGLEEDERLKAFWNQTSEHCPEVRNEMSKQKAKTKNRDVGEEKKPTRVRKLFAECGRPYNLNEPKLEFTILDEPDRYELDLHVFKYLDTSLLDVDVQPKYVRVSVRKKIFQMSLVDEVRTTESTTQRSQTTGHLLIRMPKLKYDGHFAEAVKEAKEMERKKRIASKKSLTGTVDYKNICHAEDVKKSPETDKKPPELDLDESEIPDLV